MCCRNIQRDLEGQARSPFEYVDKGMMATMGRARAVVQTKHLRLGGFVAWLCWVVIHDYFLIGFRARLLVMLEWMWLYLRSSAATA